MKPSEPAPPKIPAASAEQISTTTVSEHVPHAAPVEHQEPQISDAAGDDLTLAPASGSRILTAVIALVVGLGAGIFAGRSMAPAPAAPTEETKKAAAPESNSEVVTLTPTQSSSIQIDMAVPRKFRNERFTTGKIVFNDENITPVFAPYTGRITRLNVKPGDRVQKGDTLFEIDTPELVPSESDLISAVSALKKSTAALDLARRTEGIARRNIESARRNLELSQKNQQRQKELFEDKAVAEKDWEAAEQASQQAQKDLEQSQKDFDQSQSDIKSAENDIFSNETLLKAARDHLMVLGKTEAEVERIEKERVLDRNTRVLAPIGGTITTRKVGVGQYVRADNTDPLFVITDLTSMWMMADAYESDIALLKIGLPVAVTLMAYPDLTFNGTINYIGSSVDPNTHRIPVRCVVDNAELKLKAEMFATFHISTDQVTESPGVPSAAVVQDGDEKVVYVASDKEHEFTRRVVDTGVEMNGLVQILKGVTAGERVVVRGSLFINNKANTD